MDGKPDIKRVIELYRLVLDFRGIERLVYIPGKGDLAENDVDHSFALAMLVWFLAPHFPDLDRDKLIRLALAHDVVEIHSGDTDIFNKELVATKPARERAARRRLKQDWADFPDLHECIQEYADLATPEAQFVSALDKITPMIINYIGDGYGWHKHQITHDQLHAAKKDKVAIHAGVAKYYAELRALLLEHPEYFPDPSQQR